MMPFPPKNYFRWIYTHLFQSSRDRMIHLLQGLPCIEQKNSCLLWWVSRQEESIEKRFVAPTTQYVYCSKKTGTASAKEKFATATSATSNDHKVRLKNGIGNS
jgi:hypothetical protein